MSIATLDPLTLSLLSDALAGSSGTSDLNSATAAALIYTAPVPFDSVTGEAGNSAAGMASAADQVISLASGPRPRTGLESESEGSINPFPPSPTKPVGTTETVSSPESADEESESAGEDFTKGMGSGKTKKLVKKGKKKPFNKPKKKKVPVAKTTYVAIEEQPPLPLPGIPKSRGRPTVERGGERRGIRGRTSTRGMRTQHSGMSSEDAIAAESESEGQAQAEAAIADKRSHNTRAMSKSPRPPRSPPPPPESPPPPPRPESPSRARKGPPTPSRMKSPPPPIPKSPATQRTSPPRKSIPRPTGHSDPTDISVVVKKSRMPNIHLVVGERGGNVAVPLEQHIAWTKEIEKSESSRPGKRSWRV